MATAASLTDISNKSTKATTPCGVESSTSPHPITDISQPQHVHSPSSADTQKTASTTTNINSPIIEPADSPTSETSKLLDSIIQSLTALTANTKACGNQLETLSEAFEALEIFNSATLSTMQARFTNKTAMLERLKHQMGAADRLWEINKVLRRENWAFLIENRRLQRAVDRYVEVFGRLEGAN